MVKTTFSTWGSGCGIVGRAVASDARDPWFASDKVCLVLAVLKDKKTKEARNDTNRKNDHLTS